METGMVKWFDSRETKRFGFLLLESGEEIFFHFNDGQYVVVDPKTYTTAFSGSGTRERDGKTRRLKDPQVDDILVFERSMGARGYKAAPWGYQSTWQLQEQWIAEHQQEITARREARKQALASRPVYRVQKTMNSLRSAPGEPKILWQGQDMSELLRRYPVPSVRQSPTADPLLSYWADSDNIFEVRHWWEIQLPDGSWERCDDPRR